ncbi:GtrA family protein [Actinokineospora globicatena]|uniref:Sugar translocase n=1 Tax=Actinokineospora globicatena TaxID=103729 RepID=A0A9W6VBQ7_9PSEU|nr:GtrA family protein [Actinokineospora globicatena]MCP2306171.1 putative flippase GtrA (transmembrane translocase of bactoprenol-linked glucose) [Actinokineospora globicatena]GLW79952.1 sugar translocase [Actinokineospora globicatena]GLW86781.1 sugar translocase [Actinokineospora globicatena]GLW93198.1 sugar translocase [Actinokineospora globicatena]
MRAGLATKLRFGLVGIVNTLIDLVGYTLLTLAGAPLLVANTVSTSAGMLCSFTLNRSFTFRATSGDARAQALLFFLVTAFGLWVVQPIVITLVSGPFDGAPALVATAGPKLVALVFGLAWNYVLYSRVVFRSKEATP